MSGRPLPFIGSREPWESGEKTERVSCLLAPNPSPWTLDGTNTWCVRGSGGSIIIDPGPDDPVHLDAIVDWAVVNDAPIVEIVLTHGHIDHSEGAGALRERCGAPVRAVDPTHRLGSEGLADGAVVDAGDVELQVIATPGHTADSVSLFLPQDGSLLTGDTILGRGTAVIAWPDGNLRDYLASLTRLQDRVDVRALLPGHGPLLMEPAQVINAYLEHREVRLAQVREAMADGASDVEEIVALVYADTPREVWPAARQSVRAQVEYLRG